MLGPYVTTIYYPPLPPLIAADIDTDPVGVERGNTAADPDMFHLEGREVLVATVLDVPERRKMAGGPAGRDMYKVVGTLGRSMRIGEVVAVVEAVDKTSMGSKVVVAQMGTRMSSDIPAGLGVMDMGSTSVGVHYTLERVHTPDHQNTERQPMEEVLDRTQASEEAEVG